MQALFWYLRASLKFSLALMLFYSAFVKFEKPVILWLSAHWQQ